VHALWLPGKRSSQICAAAQSHPYFLSFGRCAVNRCPSLAVIGKLVTPPTKTPPVQNSDPPPTARRGADEPSAGAAIVAWCLGDGHTDTPDTPCFATIHHCRDGGRPELLVPVPCVDRCDYLAIWQPLEFKTLSRLKPSFSLQGARI